jgi:hypothetical protein
MSLELLPVEPELNVTALLRAYEVETIQNDLTSSNNALVSGTIYGLLAICRTAGTYSTIGFVHGVTTPSLTELRLGVHDPSTANWARVTDTGDIKASLGAGTVGTKIESALSAPVVLARGQVVALSIGGSGATMPGVLGGPGIRAGVLDTATKAGPKRGRNAFGYTTGNLPALDSTPTQNFNLYLYLKP